MEIKLTKEEKVNLLYGECPMCHKGFNIKKRKKTSHHVIPLVLKPLTIVRMNICLQCHERLNKLTGQLELNSIKDKINASDYESFMYNYSELREDFKTKKTNRGEFGEGLWTNLTSYLGTLDERISNIEVKGK